MDDPAADHAMLVFGLSLLVGPAVGGLAGWLKGFLFGGGTGALLIGLAGLYGAVTVGMDRYHLVADTVRVEGNLVEFVTERGTDAQGQSRSTRAPVVEYTASDGVKRRVQGLGGGLANKDWGDAVDVRYSKADPAQARVDDFQNMWGIVWALGLFGGFPTFAGLFFLGVAAKEGRPDAPPRQPTPVQQRWRTRGTVFANVVFIAGFALAFLYPDANAMKQVGVGFMTIGAGALLHFVVQSCPPAMDFEFRSILAIIGLVFAAFGYGAWKMA